MVADLMSIGKTMLGRRHILPSVVSTLTEMQVEGTFRTGTYLVTVHHPISSDDGDLEKALYGSFLHVPSRDLFPLADASEYGNEKMPGAVIPVKEGRITLNKGRKRIQLKVTSKGDRPIQVWLVPSLCVYPDMSLRRSDRIITSSRLTPNSYSTEPGRTATVWTSQLEPPSASNQETPRPSRSSR